MADRRAAIPGAHVLADVAAEDLAAHLRAQRLGNGAPLLDGQVGDAAARVHLVGRDQSARGAGIDAARAAAAAVFRESMARGGQLEAVRITPRKSHDPSCWLRMQVFLPIQPMPAYLA